MSDGPDLDDWDVAPLSMPHSFVGAYLTVLELDEGTFAELKRSLGDSSPVRPFSELVADVEAVGVVHSMATRVVRALVELGTHVGIARVSLPEAAAGLAASTQFSLSSDERRVLAERVVELLDSGTLNLVAKASALLQDAENVFNGVKIVTDLRPVFPLDARNRSDVPGIEATVIVHRLRIDAHDERGGVSSTHFALNDSELKQLADEIQFALMKADSVRSLMRAAGIPCIDMHHHDEESQHDATD